MKLAQLNMGLAIMAPKILIVEDDPSTRVVLSAVLKHDYELLFAKNGMEGLSTLEEDSDIALIIADVYMPILDGFQMTSYAKKNEKIKDTPILIMSGQSSKANIQEARDLKAVGWIAKPIVRKELLALIKKILASTKPKATPTD